MLCNGHFQQFVLPLSSRAFAASFAVRRLCMPPTRSVFVALKTSRRNFFVCFRETPNEACYKFFVNGMEFLPRHQCETLCFDLDNCHLSPLAEHILHNLPMVEEVTIGKNFITVRRVEDADVAAAARRFSVKAVNSGTPLVSGGTAPGTAVPQRPDPVPLVSQASHSVGSSPGLSNDRIGTSKPMAQSGDDNRIDVTGGNENENNTDDHRTLRSGGPMHQDMTEDAVDEQTLRDLMLSTHWSDLKLHVSALLTDHLYSGRPHVDVSAPHPHPDTLPQEGDSELVLMLKELIVEFIRPQLQHDGGDIRFVGLDGPVMLVEMLGACRKCRSSKTTLHDLIERTTRHWLPEVQGVREVEGIGK
uniref:Putative HIRA-interacting protein 5 n=1 Tax=Trypanosoma vivax (strain Y486) TaxID=1055687 RepID=G0U828_TRYVY|nr:putative HIRA-interacting protein 5 [Trypanosoma vivax Y486]